jgi:hypothetical protein
MAHSAIATADTYTGDDATWRARCTDIHNFMVGAMGLVQTADTGQLDFTTAIKPGVGYAVLGYRMYRFNDAAQSTHPIFVKVGYGTGATSNFFGLYIYIGESTNGALTLGGGWAATQVGYLPGGGAGAQSWAACGGAGYAAFIMSWGTSTTTYNYLFAIERAANGLGAMVVSFNGYGRRATWLPYGLAPVQMAPNTTGLCSPNNAVSAADPNVANTIHTFPFRAYSPGEIGAFTCIVGYFHADIPVNAVYAIVGADLVTRSYYSFGKPFASGHDLKGELGGTSGIGLMLRWD